MSTNIVMVFDSSDRDTAALIDEELRKSFQKEGNDVEPVWAPSQEHAMRAVRHDCALLITPLEIRETATIPIRQGEERGIDLAKWTGENTDIASILIVPSYTDKLQAAQPDLKRCIIVPTSSATVQKVAERAIWAVRGRPQKCLDIEIQLVEKTRWLCTLKPNGFSEESNFNPTTCVVDVEGRIVDEIRDLSSALGGDRNSAAAVSPSLMRMVGEKLLDALSRDSNCYTQLVAGLTLAGGEENARVTFAVSPELHKLALEMVVCPKSRPKHWMLQAPVFRRLLADRPTTGSLFQGGRKMNCLVVEATASGYVGALDQNLPPLQSVTEECSWLENQAEAFNMTVEVIRPESSEGSFLQRLQNALQSNWDIVHFAGHSYYDEHSNTGYVFAPGSAAGSIEKIDIVHFSAWIRHCNLFYFSSCDSGAGPFMFELAARGVPNMVGFRWEIDDRLALPYTKKFYTNLFADHSLERAFLKSRQGMHDSFPDSVIWAAPLLIKQSPD